MTVEDELRRMGVLEANVPVVAKAIYNASVSSALSVDGILNGIKILMALEVPRVQALDIEALINYQRDDPKR